ncbi:hypothetical protein BLD25_03200 [Candidatus Gracilibacteria bacterium GN02-872]|nr:hypothetical protein BLD25_03200 [Candidatus Gracilibacteria bacterium GN02-872]
MKKDLFKKIFLGIFILFIVFQIWCFYSILFFDDSKSPGIIFLIDRNGTIITDKANSYGYQKPGKIDLNSKFVKSLLLIEDKNFYSHFGINVLAKLRALTGNISSGAITSGGSTITEQFLKNKYFLKKKRTYLQKLKEANLAFFFSIFKSKDEILKNYLESIYFGNNLYGINSAIEVYFGKYDLNDLTDEEITLLLALLRNPGTKSINEKNFSEVFERIKTKLNFDFEKKITNLNKKENIDKFPFVTSKFCNGNTKKCIGKTSIDSELQTFAQKTLNKTISKLNSKNVTNGVVLAINPETMEVLVYLGSKDFYSKNIDGQVDILQTALRQPGSTMKPFLYLLALEKGASLNKFLVDLSSSYDSFSEGKTYFSENYNLKEYGLVRFGKALGNSLNNATVRLSKQIGLKEVFEFYKKYGFKFLENEYQFFGYSLVLGNASLTLNNLALSYVNLIPDFETNPNRKLNFSFVENKISEKPKKVDENKYLLYKILQNPNNRDLSFGVNSILNTSIYQAVKTGTSSNFRDNVVISYSKNFLLLVWVGNNDNSPMKGVSGITGAGYIWHQVVEKAISKGFIKKDNYGETETIRKRDYCLDEKCFRKEINFDKNEKYFSRLFDKKYSKKDLFIEINGEERQKLKDLGFELTE